jgi:hypothetical protein
MYWTLSLECFETAPCAHYFMVTKIISSAKYILKYSVQKMLCLLRCSTGWEPWASSLLKTLQPQVYSCALHYSTGWEPWASSLLKTLQPQVYSCTLYHRLGTLGFLSTKDSAAPGLSLYSTAQAGNHGLPLYWRLCSPRIIPVLHSTGWEPWASSLLKTLQLQVYSCTPQHRLGTLCFLSTEDSAAPGIFLYSTA